MTAGLSKKERLCCVTAIDRLMAEGRYLSNGHLRCCWKKTGDGGIPRMMVSVPKKLFKRAVKRNLLKRRIREAFRMQKHLLDGMSVDMMFVYTGKEPDSFKDIFAAMQHILASVSERQK